MPSPHTCRSLPCHSTRACNPRPCLTLHQKPKALSKDCFRVHSRPLSLVVIMSCSEGRQLQRRLDVRAETSSFVARPLFLWAFQSSKRQLQAIFGPRASLLQATAAQTRTFGSHLGTKQRQRLVSCSRLSHTSHVTRHTSHVTRHTSHLTHRTSHVTRHTSHIMRHTSCVTRHTSHVTRHTSHVTRHAGAGGRGEGKRSCRSQAGLKGEGRGIYIKEFFAQDSN